MEDSLDEGSDIRITWSVFVKGAVWTDPVTEGYMNVNDQKINK